MNLVLTLLAVAGTACLLPLVSSALRAPPFTSLQQAHHPLLGRVRSNT